MNYTMVDGDTEFLVEIITRAPVLKTVADGPVDRREVESRLEISRTTCHRIVRSFEERGLITRTGEGYELTSQGYAILREVRRFTENIQTTQRLEPLLSGLDPATIEFDPGMFTGATVTRAEPENPYPPINRFMELLRDSTTLRSLDKTSIAPLYVEEIAGMSVEEGLEVKAIYGHDVVNHLLSEYPTELKPTFETGRNRFWVHNNISFGLSIFDERMGLRAYDPESGAYTVFVDTGAPEAYAWAEDIFESYRTEAEPLSEAGDFPNWAE